MVCGGSISSSGGVWVKNVVYREVFQNHLGNIFPSSQDTSIVDISFPDTPLTQSQIDFDQVMSPVKRAIVPDDSEPLSKFPKLSPFTDNNLIPFLDSQISHSSPNGGSPDVIFDGVITNPVDMGEDIQNGLNNKFTLPMQRRIASSIGLDAGPILLNRDIVNLLDRNLLQYYSSLENRLLNTFHIGISLVPVIPDGNCLYRALSHIIFGTQSKYATLKQHLISTFLASQEHFPNVMEKSGLFSEQELHEHILRISAHDTWGTDVELIKDVVCFNRHIRSYYNCYR